MLLGICQTTGLKAGGKGQANGRDLLAFACQKADVQNVTIIGGCKTRMTPPGIFGVADRRGTGNLSRSPRKVRLLMPGAKSIFA
jgi:hypothetical protein